jgi:outer membrane lipoprotein-sorting protein
MRHLFKRVFPAALAVILTLSGCAGQTVTQDETSLYDKIQNTLKTLETYEATAAVRYISNNNIHQYTVKQQAKNSGEYRVEVLSPENAAGNITTFDGSVICQYNSKVAGKIAVGTTESSERSEIFLTSFINNYFVAAETAQTVANMEDNDEMTVLEAVIPGENKYLATEKLFIRNDTLKPKELVIYDEDGNERIVVVFTEIEYNVKLDDAQFSAKE